MALLAYGSGRAVVGSDFQSSIVMRKELILFSDSCLFSPFFLFVWSGVIVRWAFFVT